MESANRAVTAETVDPILARLDWAAGLPDVAEALRYEDTSADLHRTSNMLWFERAGLDAELADALDRFDDDAAHRPLYPDVTETLAALKARNVKIAVVSDIHFDMRILLESQGVADYIDAHVLSFEHGCQRPDPKMFSTALALLDVRAERTLMVGDRASHDGGSVAVGIAAFILPPPPPVLVRRGLDVLPHMVGGRDPRPT